MGYTTDEDGENDGRMPDLTATIVDAGVDYRSYGNDNEESRLVILWKPDNDVFGVQTEILSNGGILKVDLAARDIRVGGPERGFNIEIIGHIIQSGKLGYKAALWMAKLKALGVKTPEDSGNLKELIGIRAVIKQLTYNEAKGRPKKDSEKVFWVPVEIISTSEGKALAGDEVKLQEEKKPAEEVECPTLKEDILANAEGLNEAELVAWYEKSQYYDGATVVPVFMALTEILGAGAMKEKGGKYVVGITEHIATVEDDLGALDDEGEISPSNTSGGK